MNRLLSHWEPEDGDHFGSASLGLLLERLLEEGDSADLAELVGRLGREPLVQWVRERGGRQLSRRSRFFWEVVLEVEAAPRPCLAERLWPL